MEEAVKESISSPKGRLPVREVAAEIPASLAQFRNQYRSEVVGPFYNGYAHLGFVVIGSTAVIGTAIWQLRSPVTWLELLNIPSTFLVANFVEYFGHRGPMHKHIKRLGLIFHRHTHEHHRFFTEDCMTCRSQRDFKIVLFPPIMLLLYLGLVAFPIGLLLCLLHAWNVACIYIAMVTFYFLSYELLHFCYHLDESSWIARLPVIRALRHHHRMHHNASLMSKYNFNITWPIADYVFGTIYRERKQDAAHTSASLKNNGSDGDDSLR